MLVVMESLPAPALMRFIKVSRIKLYLSAAGCRNSGGQEKEASMLIRILAIAISLLCCSMSHAEEAVEIPLTEIWSTNQKRMWAVDEPVTKYLGELTKDDEELNRLLWDTVEFLDIDSRNQKAGKAFAVDGTGLEALRNAHAVFSGKDKAAASLDSDQEISIVFFSLQSAYYISLTKVHRVGAMIDITYEYIPKEESNVPSVLAFIPLGKLTPGHYQVLIEHEPFEKRFGSRRQSGPHKDILGRVSKSFEFEVK
jgi:hypothetical protein